MELPKEFKEKLSQIIYSDTVSKTNRKLAEYIILNYRYIVFMNASELAKEVGVSQPSVTRFVTSLLQFKGYPHFVTFLQDIIRVQITGSDRYVISSAQQDSNISKVINREIESLEKISENISDEYIHHIAEEIVSHKTIYILGFRTGSFLAKYLQFFYKKSIKM